MLETINGLDLLLFVAAVAFGTVALFLRRDRSGAVSAAWDAGYTRGFTDGLSGGVPDAQSGETGLLRVFTPEPEDAS